MKKAVLRLLPIEREYIDRFGELPEDTWDKYGHSDEGLALVQSRMEDICDHVRKRAQEKKISDLEKEGCPWLT